jgi:ribosome-associated protein
MTENPSVSREELLKIVVDALEELKAKDIKIIDVHGKTTVTDIMVIATGTSTRHVKALADHVVYQAKHVAGLQPLGTEGERSMDWMLVDLLDVVVHIFTPETRDFYNLEKLWETPSSDSAAAE